jgi:hypothetical protein
MKKKKTENERLHPRELDRRVSALIARTKPEDLFPAAYKRAVESLRKAGLI